MIQPTYSALEIRQMCLEWPMEYSTFKILVDIIEEDLDLYSVDELSILFEASMIMFTRSILQMSLKGMR
jgi:hypothetical protein